jgi:hypothetical protein
VGGRVVAVAAVSPVRIAFAPAEGIAMTTAHGAVARVACFTEHACLVGDIAVETQGQPRRVLDLLNETRTSTVALNGPTLVRPERLDLPLGTFATGRVRKADLLCVGVIDEPERSTGRRLASYVAKTPVRVVLLLRSLALIGTVHVNARTDPLDLVLAWPEPFLSLTEAGLIPDGVPVPDGAPPEPMTIFVNRAHIVGALSHEPSAVSRQPSANRYSPASLAAPR